MPFNDTTLKLAGRARALTLIQAVFLAGVLNLSAIGHAGPLGNPPAAEKSAKPSSSPADPSYRRGTEALSRADLIEAENSFRNALKVDARHVPAMLGLAELGYKMQRMDEAGEWIRRAVSANPNSAEAQASLGRFLVLKGQGSDAQAALMRSIELDPMAFRPRIDLADLLLSAGDSTHAIAMYRDALVISPQHAGARYGLGQALLIAGELGAARDELLRAAELARGNPLPFVALARVELARQKPDAGLAEVEKALAIQPSLVEALIVKGDLLDAKGLGERALKEFRLAAQLAPKAAMPHLRIAMIEQQRGRTDAAILAYQQALLVDPGQATALNNLASIYAGQGRDLAKAEVMAKRAVSLIPDAAQFHDTLGEVLAAQGNWKAAAGSFTSAVQRAPRDAGFRLHLGQALVNIGEFARAKKELEEVMRLAPKTQSALDAQKLLARVGR